MISALCGQSAAIKAHISCFSQETNAWQGKDEFGVLKIDIDASNAVNVVRKLRRCQWIHGMVVDLHLPGGGAELGGDGATLPFLFWRVSIERRRSPPSGAEEVSRGEPG